MSDSGCVAVCAVYRSLASLIATRQEPDRTATERGSPSASSAGVLPVWSNGPVRNTKSVLSAMVLTQCACSDSVRINLPWPSAIVPDCHFKKAHVLPRPHFDGPVTASRIDHTLSAPAYNVDTGRMASEHKVKLACRSIPHADRAVFRSRGYPLTRSAGEVQRLKCEGSDPFTVAQQGLAGGLTRLRRP